MMLTTGNYTKRFESDFATLMPDLGGREKKTDCRIAVPSMESLYDVVQRSALSERVICV